MARKKFEGDDGRVISNMNVPGMPWHDPMDNTVPRSKDNDVEKTELELTKSESAAIMWGSLKAAMLIAGIFSAIGILVVLGFLFYDDLIRWISSIF